MHKDMKMAMQLSQKNNLALPMTAVAQQMHNAIVTMGLSDLDSSALLLVNKNLNLINNLNVNTDLLKVTGRRKTVGNESR